MAAEHFSQIYLEDTIADQDQVTSENAIARPQIPSRDKQTKLEQTGSTYVETPERAGIGFSTEEPSADLTEDISRIQVHWSITRPQRLPNVKALIDKETEILDIFSDSIGSALLAVIQRFSPLNVSQMLSSLDIPETALRSYIELLENNRLITFRQGTYNVSDNGIQLLRSLHLLDETE